MYTENGKESSMQMYRAVAVPLPTVVEPARGGYTGTAGAEPSPSLPPAAPLHRHDTDIYHY